MREFQPSGVLVAASTTYANNATTDLLHPSNESVRSPMSMDSHFSLLTAASSTLSIVSPQCDWPEFQESYNSIMDNTNLLDSCAAALNDISTEDGLYSLQPEKMRCEFSRSLSSTTNSSFSGSDNLVTSKSVEQFTRWLCEMENRVAAQPKLSKIVTMKPKQMATQLDVHSKIFKEIVAKPCIVKGTKHKALEERYHLLYLKVYEVLLLLEGLPANSFSPSNHILSESFHDYDCNSSTNSKEHSSDHVDNIDNNNEFLNDVICDKNDSELKTPIYTETSVLSTSIGTYYFNYDDSIINQQKTMADDNTSKISINLFDSCDKEFTFENDLHSLLNATDSLHLKSIDNIVVTEQRPLQQQLTEDTIHIVSQKNHIWNRIDFCELATSSPQATKTPTEHNELSHYKVYDWLHAKTDSYESKSTVSLDCSTVSEADYQLLYRAKSEMDLSLCRPLDAQNRMSSLRTSLNCLPSILSPVKHFESTCLNDSIVEESSLIWDNFQLGNEFIKADSDYGFAGSDFETKELINKLCYFGDDYSMHLNESITTESEKEMEQNVIKSVPVMNVFEAPPPLSPSGSVKVRRSRRLRNKRLRALNLSDSSCDSTSSELHSILSLDQSSESNLSEATTASVNSNMNQSPATVTIDNSQTTPSYDEFTPEKTISYNSNEKQFELHTKESTEPKKMKINEMRPEDFHDIVKMCQSNIDCVITVLGADPNRILTVAYCQQMKYERYQKLNTETCKCKQQNTDTTENNQLNQRTMDTQCICNSDIVENKTTEICICTWVQHTIAMILNFLIDCWNVFRNMKLYTYLCKVTKALFGSTRYVADHLKSKQAIANAKTIKYS